jgi:hypothetical protein
MFDEHQQKMRERSKCWRQRPRGDNRASWRWEKLTVATAACSRATTLLPQQILTRRHRGGGALPRRRCYGTEKLGIAVRVSGRRYEPDVGGGRAHNRWLDFVAKSPERRVGLAVAPLLHDIDVAVTEIREAKRWSAVCSSRHVGTTTRLTTTRYEIGKCAKSSTCRYARRLG